MDWARVISLMRGGVVVDGRNCLEGEAIVAQGGVYLSMGRHATAAPSLLPQTEQPTVAPSIALG
jgi:hypothetical protein